MQGRWRTIALQALPEVAKKKLPLDFAAHLRPVDPSELGSYSYIVQSFNKEEMEYRVDLRYVDGFWQGRCTCPGWVTHQKRADPLPACTHIVAGLLGTKEFIPSDHEELAAFDRTAVGGQRMADSGKAPQAVEELVFWASQLGMVEACPASKVTDEDSLLIATQSEAADIGTAVHECCRRMVEGHIPTEDEVDDIVLEHQLDTEAGRRVQMHFRAAKYAWLGRKGKSGLQAFFTNPLSEQKLRHKMKAVNPHTGQPMTVTFSGKYDFASLIAENGAEQPTLALIGDWKTGKVLPTAKALPQLKGYALMTFAKHPSVQKVRVVLVWLADWSWTAVEFGRAEIREWAEGFLSYSAFWDGRTYGPGEACRYCARSMTCPARCAMLRSSVLPFLEPEFSAEALVMDGGTIRPAADVLAAYEGAKLAQAAAGTLIFMVEEWVKTVGPILDQEHGVGLIAVPKKGNREIDVNLAWPILTGRFDQDSLAKVVTLGMGALEDLTKKSVQKGKGAAAWRDLLQVLGDAQAIRIGQGSMTVKLTEIGPSVEQVEGENDEAGEEGESSGEGNGSSDAGE